MDGTYLSHHFKTQILHNTRSVTKKIRLGVPYYDNAGEPSGMSAVCAMAAEFIAPGCLIGSSDRRGQYIKILRSYGSVNNIESHIATLRQLGIAATIRHSGSMGVLISHLAKGIPVPVSWRYNGPVNAPVDHRWTLAVGWNEASRELIMHDPRGRGDLDRGGFISGAAGEGVFTTYKRGRFSSRWIGSNCGSGRYIHLEKIA